LETEVVEYPCPECGRYNKPYMHNLKGYAFQLCEGCGTQYKTSTRVSASFRRYCSRTAQNPNRSPTFYTSSEKKVKKLMEAKGYVEGIDYWHNVRIADPERKGVYFWLDFYLPLQRLVVECSPRVWHALWDRRSSDRRKRLLVESYGLRYLEVDGEELDRLDHVLGEASGREPDGS